jgi:predicted ribosomally synthesized peptide with nif11-like leader
MWRLLGHVMSEEQFAALLLKLKEDEHLQAKFKSATDFAAVASIANEAGFDVQVADFEENLESLEPYLHELEAVSGGKTTAGSYESSCFQYQTPQSEAAECGD